jgi:hypothetical protein
MLGVALLHARGFRCVLGIALKGMRAVAYETTSLFDALVTICGNG